MKTKIVLVARNCDSSAIVYNYLKQSINFEAVIVEKTISPKKQLEKRIKRMGFWHAAGQAAFMMMIYPLLKKFSQKRKKEIIEKYELDINPIPTGAYTEVNSLNSEESRKLLQQLNPDLVIVNGTRIISKKTLDCIAAPFINVHVGITPLFRGVHGGYWAVASGNKDLFGVTIHYVDAGVDTGGIIEQVLVTPSSKDNLYTYPYLKYGVCMPVLKKIVEKFMDGEKPPVKESIVKESSLWYHPTLFQWLKNLKRTFLFLIIPAAAEILSYLFCNRLCPEF